MSRFVESSVSNCQIVLDQVSRFHASREFRRSEQRGPRVIFDFDGTYDLHDRLKANLPNDVASLATLSIRDSMRTEHLIDVGTGTGTAAVALGPLFDHVTLLDRDPNMLARASRRLRRIHGGVTEQLSDAESLDRNERLPPFSVAVFCRSFNMLDTDTVLNFLAHESAQDAAVMVLDDTSWWNLREPWSGELRQLLVRHIGEQALPVISEQEEKLAASPFNKRIASQLVPVTHVLRPQDVVNLTFATSYSSRAKLGEAATYFEQELLQVLSRHTDPSGKLSATNPYKLVVGYRQD